MNEQAIRFRFGIFVLASLILLAVLTLLFGGFPNYFKRTETYTIIFGNAQGVGPGTPVRRSGVAIGEVQTVTLDNVSGKVEVVIRIDEKYYLRKGDRPTIQQGLIGGDAAIAFLAPENPKDADPTPVPPGSVLQGYTPADAATVLQKSSDLVVPVQEALIEIRKTFKRINEMTPLVEETLKDLNAVGKTVNVLGPDLQKTSEEIRALSKMTRESIPELRRTNEEVQITARNWGRVGERVDVLLRTNEDKITRSIERADETLRRLNELMSDENQKYLRDTLKNVRNGTQQLESISNDTSLLVKESRVAVRQLNETLRRADATLIDMQKAVSPFGDKGPAFFKNLDEGTDSLNKTLRDLRELMQVIARSDGTVQRLLSDPALYNNLNDSAQMITRMLPRVDRMLKDFEVFADKAARHPEVLGIGGALRPSSGLKESPSVIPYRVYKDSTPVNPYRTYP